MDKATTGVKPQATRDQAAAIEREIESIRGHLDGLVSELDNRRHALNPVVAARRHPAAFAVAGALVVIAVGTALAVHSARKRRLKSWLGRGRRLKGALGDLMEGKVATIAPNFGARMLSALATAAAGVVGKRVATQLLSRNG